MERYAKTFTVRWADCDVNGHMRNTSYSEYAIDTRMAYLAENGFPFEKFVESGIGPVLLHESIDYLREVPLGGTLEVVSPDGGGTRLTATFPLSPDPEAPEPLASRTHS